MGGTNFSSQDLAELASKEVCGIVRSVIEQGQRKLEVRCKAFTAATPPEEVVVRAEDFFSSCSRASAFPPPQSSDTRHPRTALRTFADWSYVWPLCPPVFASADTQDALSVVLDNAQLAAVSAATLASHLRDDAAQSLLAHPPAVQGAMRAAKKHAEALGKVLAASLRDGATVGPALAR